MFRLVEALLEKLEEAAAVRTNDPIGGEEKFNAASSALNEFCDLLTAAPTLSPSDRNVIRDTFENLRIHAMSSVTEKLDKKCGLHFSSQLRSSIMLDRLLTKASRHVIGDFLLTTAEAEARALEASSSSCSSTLSSVGLTEVLPRTTASSAPVISIADVVTANFDGQSVEAFVRGVVLADTRDAEDVIVALAGRAFKANVCVWQPEADPGSGLKCLTGDDSVTQIYGDVHLLLYSGHYNLLYTTSAPEFTDAHVIQTAQADTSSSASSSEYVRIPHNVHLASSSSRAHAQSVGDKRPRDKLADDITQGRLFATSMGGKSIEKIGELRMRSDDWPRHSIGVSASVTGQKKGALSILDRILPAYDADAD